MASVQVTAVNSYGFLGYAVILSIISVFAVDGSSENIFSQGFNLTNGIFIYFPHGYGIGTVLYLRIPYEVLKERLGDLHERGVSMKEGQTLKDLYEERRPLYEKYADVVIDCEGRTIREIVHEIADELRGENE